MRKYLQITIVLSIFGLLVFLRQVWGKEEMSIVENKNLQNPTANSPSSTNQSQIPTPTQQSPLEPQATALPTIPPAPVSTGAYKNGTYTGKVADAYYGNIQVQAVISGGKITDVIFLQYPNDNRTSQYINSQAAPMLKQEAIQAQSAKVDIISGASASSDAFQVSLADALAQAK